MKIEFKAINNPRLHNGDFGFDWCDRCDSQQAAFVEIEGHYRLCKTCLTEAISIIDKTILKDAVDKGKLPRFPQAPKE